MKMVSLKLSKKEKKDLIKPGILKEDYPYSTRITIEDDQFKSLPIYDNVSVGDSVTIKAKAKVTRISESESSSENGSNDHCSVELQLTDIGVEPDNDSEMDEGFKKGSEEEND
jgi:hypothetical protein